MQLLAGLVFALGASMAQAMVLIVDDWNVTTGDSISDSTADGSTVFAPRISTGGTSLPRETFMANLTAGDGVSTEDCALCQMGHFANDASSEGHGYWGWRPSDLDLTGYSSIMLDISTDVAGADIILSFSDTGVAPIAEVWWKDLPSTTSLTLTALLPSGLTDVNFIYLDVLSVGGTYDDASASNWLGTRDYGAAAVGLDLDVDNLKLVAVPAPAPLALLSLGLAGIGYQRRKQAKAA